MSTPTAGTSSSSAPSASRVSALAAYVATSVAIAALALTGHVEIALAIAAPAYGWLQSGAHRRLQRVEASVGPANGQNVHELLELNNELLGKLVELDRYSHGRNHDILGALTPPNARLELELLELQDRTSSTAAELAAVHADLEQLLELEGIAPARPQPPTEGTDQ